MSRRLLVLLIVANSACAQFAGDIDEDGVATAIDVVSLANHLNASVPLSLDRLRLADVDQNAIIDAADLEALAAAVVGQHQLLPMKKQQLPLLMKKNHNLLVLQKKQQLLLMKKKTRKRKKRKKRTQKLCSSNHSSR